jgi:hypothetical protein
MKQKKDPQTSDGAVAQERSPAETFDAFLGSVPDTDRITVSLRRLPSYITPHVSQQESLPPPGFQTNLEAMETEVRARYGPGRYKLWVRWRHPETRTKDRMTAPEFTLAPVADDFIQGRGEPAEHPDTSETVQDSLGHLARAAKIQAQATELSALRSAVSGPAPTSAPDTLGQMKLMTDILKNLAPHTDPMTMLKTAKELFGPSTPHDPAGTLSLLDKLGDVLQKFGGEGGASRSEGFWGFATEAMRHVGPNLDRIVDVALRVLVQMQTGAAGASVGIDGAPAPAISSPISGGKSLPENSPQAIARELTGGDPHALLALQTWLNMALVELSGPLAATMPQDGYGLLLDYLDTHLPVMVQRWGAAPADAVWTVWTTLDPRILQIPAARLWLDGLLQAAKAPAETPPGGSDE